MGWVEVRLPVESDSWWRDKVLLPADEPGPPGYKRIIVTHKTVGFTLEVEKRLVNVGEMGQRFEEIELNRKPVRELFCVWQIIKPDDKPLKIVTHHFKTIKVGIEGYNLSSGVAEKCQIENVKVFVKGPTIDGVYKVHNVPFEIKNKTLYLKDPWLNDTVNIIWETTHWTFNKMSH
jgi:hypothetical protein